MRLLKTLTTAAVLCVAGAALGQQAKVTGLQTTVKGLQNFDYEISGKFPGAEKILLSEDRYGGVLLDSAQNPDGSFVFKGKAKAVSLGTLIVENKKKMFSEYFNVFIEPGKIKVKLYEGGKQIEAKGSTNNDIMTVVEAENKAFWFNLSSIYDSLNYASMRMSQIRKADVVDKDSITYYGSLYKRMEAAAAPYIAARNEKLKVAFKKYPKTYFTAYRALNSGVFDETTLKSMYAGFDDKLKKSAIGKEWDRQLFNVKKITDGVTAPEFAVPDADGKQVKLSDFKGKYVLLDFWATWCGPCRAGNPHLISVYKKYKDQGLEFIGIADDDNNIVGWKKAIKDDGIGLWPQVLRNRAKQNDKGENIDLSSLYEVGGYPTKILIDKEGKIVHQFADDAELDTMLSQIFKQ